MDYIVLECTQTMEFCRWGHKPYGLWVPVEAIRRTKRRGNNLVVEIVYLAAMPGYAFVPRSNWVECRRHVPSQYRVSVMEYDYVGRPKTVSLDDLTRMQEFIQGERLESLALEDAPLVIGDKVTIMVAPFEGMRGTIQKIRNDSVRLLVGTKYISLNPRFLQKV